MKEYEKLDKMSIQELGKLFPVTLSSPNKSWPQLYFEEKKLIKSMFLKGEIKEITHIGSTSIPNIKAKPIIDILVEIHKNTDIKELKNRIESLNYHCLSKPENPPPHIMFVKGYTLNGFTGQVYHVHVRYPGNWDEIYFKNHLVDHPEVARKYEKLKVLLALKYKNNRELYTKGKTDFIKRICSLRSK